MYKTAIELLKKITSFGFAAYIVGGYPRDLYLKRSTVDIDICTNATPKELNSILGDVMLPTVQYGSITVIINKIRFEITTFRKDIKYENNRLPIKIKYIDNLKDDLARRDFTINTLCIGEDEQVIDLLDATEDLNNKIVRMVGNPKIKLKEDSLRILRAIRFATTLDFRIDNELKKYIKEYGYLLRKLSYFRKKEELDKIFASSNVKYGIELIKELGLDEFLELKNIDKVFITSSVIGIWAQLDVANIYAFSNNEKDLINEVNELLKCDLLDDKVLYHHGLYTVSLVGEIKGISRKEITKKYSELYIKSRNDIDIEANEICLLLNKKPSSFLKDIFNDLEEKLVNKEIINDKEVIKEYILKNYVDLKE